MPKSPDTIAQSVRKPTNYRSKSKINRQYPQIIDKQWITGYVKKVITSRYHSEAYSDPKEINSIIAIPHGDNLEASYGGDMAATQFYPLLRGIVDVPSQGDQVLLCNFGGNNYYLGPINTENKTCINPDHKYNEIIEAGYNPYEAKFDSTDVTSDYQNYWAEIGVSPYFPKYCPNRLEKPYIHLPWDLDGVGHSLPIAHMRESEDLYESKLREIPGDLLLEGRFGNSIRLGSRNDTPILTISNRNRDTSDLGYETTTDGSILTMINNGNIDANFEQGVNTSNSIMLGGGFKLSSDINISPDAVYSIGPALYDYRYGLNPVWGNQVLLRSDKITIDSFGDSIFLSARKGVVVGSGIKTIIKSHKSIHLESTEIYLGGNHQSEISEDPEMVDGEFEPMVHGQQLVDILKELIEGLKMMSIPTMLGPQVAATVGILPSLVKAEQALQTVLSKKVFIENHGTTPT